jgi:hypothetical protein
MLAQLEVKEINSKISRTSTDFLVLEFFFQFKDFPGFPRPAWTPSYSFYTVVGYMARFRGEVWGGARLS